ncbi:MAG: radical SAM protein [Deltaproteobacteria bacterium]|nr:radical SAM protein [Deltaproteobacteria bacterium]
MKIRLHAFEPTSRANGPGLRAVIWFQGCTLGCPGCFNPTTHEPNDGYETKAEVLAADLITLPGIEGVSISGGEPFQQPEALADLVRRLRQTSLSILIFSGYTLKRIQTMPLGPTILASIDVLVAGPYVREQHSGRGLLGSTNQHLHLLTSRYQPSDFTRLPRREIILHRDGTMTVTGFAVFEGVEKRDLDGITSSSRLERLPSFPGKLR